MEWIISNIVIVAILIAVILVVTILMTGYVKAPPDMAFIISGLRKKPRILIGQAGIKIPFLERKDTLLLKHQDRSARSHQRLHQRRR